MVGGSNPLLAVVVWPQKHSFYRDTARVPRGRTEISGSRDLQKSLFFWTSRSSAQWKRRSFSNHLSPRYFTIVSSDVSVSYTI